MSNTVSVSESSNSVVVVESDNTVTVTQTDNAVTVTSPGPVGPAPAITSYTVTGGTDGTQPTFSGDPLFTGRAVRIGDFVHFDVQVDFDNITSFGTGQYFVSLPYPALTESMVRGGSLFDFDTGLEYNISGHIEPGSTTMQLFTTDITGQNVHDFPFEQGEPVTLTTADKFHIGGSYFAVAANTPPGQVTGLSATAGNAQVVLVWSAPSPGGSPIVDYVVQFSTDDATWTTFSDGTSTATTATVTGLSNGTLYYFRVAAVNDAATGVFSTSVTATPAAFSPLDLSPVLWLDAADTSTITESGGAVSQWDDKSGNGNHVTQGTAAAQPTTGTRTINSLNVVYFQADVMTNTTSITSSSCVVAMVVSWSNGVRAGIYGGGTANDPGLFQNTTGSTNWKSEPTTATEYPIGSGSNGSVLVVGHGLTSYARKDGVLLTETLGPQSSTAGRSITNYGKLGRAAVSMSGDIAEVIIVDGTLSAGEIDDTEAYLAAKWGITL